LADLTQQLPGVWKQIWLVAGLRWTILKNSMQRKNNRWDLVGVIFASIFTAMVVLGLAFAFYAGAYGFLKTNRPEWISLLFWGIFVWWQVLPMFLAGFGANFEFGTLLRFPLSLRAFYILGLGYGMADLGAVAAGCWMLAMLAGAMKARIAVVPVLLVICLLFFLFNLTLERLIGSWLEKLLAKRRTRELFFGLIILSMVSMNFISPLMQKYGKSARPTAMALLPYLSWTPGTLAGTGVTGAALSEFGKVAIGVSGLLIWIAIATTLLWFRYRAQYLGEEIAEGSAAAVVKRRVRSEAVGAEWPNFVRPSVIAVSIKEFRYLIRNGFAFVTLIIPPVMVLFFSFQFAGGDSPLKEHSLKPEMLFPGIMAYLILILMSPAYNSFAYESKGIQTYFLAPVPFEDVLMGKNLFLVALVVFEMILSLSLLTWRIGLPHISVLASTLTAGAFAVTGQLTIANWAALSFPRKMEIGKMRGQRNSGLAVWTAFGVQIVLAGICSVVIFVGNWTRNPWLPTIVFLALAAAAGGGYAASLKSMNGYAEKKKELLIETLCR